MNDFSLTTLSAPAKAGLFAVALLVVSLLSACQSNKEDNTFAVTTIRLETRFEPNLCDKPQPRFSWVIESGERGIEQTHYKILVSSSYQKLAGDTADVWDSGRIKSGQSIQVPYDGPDLQGITTYYWKVKVWCKGKGYASSIISSWNTGMLRETDWNAKWIGLDSITGDDRWEGEDLLLSARYLRGSLFLDEQPEDANLYIAGVGTYTVYLNGLPLGGHVLSSVSSDQSRRVMYTMYSLATFLLPGENVFGVVLGNGSNAGAVKGLDSTFTMSFPKLLFQLEVTKTNGERVQLISDTSWRMTTAGPIRENSLHRGELYDGTRIMPNCFKKGYDDATWMNVRLTKAPGELSKKARVVAQPIEEMKMVNTIQPVAILNQKPGSFILDFGQNQAGLLKIQVRGERGREIRLTYGDKLNADGSLHVGGTNRLPDMDRFVLAGAEKDEILKATFSYHSFRYVQVSNWPGEPNTRMFTCEMISDGLNSSGSFHSSNNDLNALYSNAWWTVASSYKGIPLDGSLTNPNKASLAYRSNGAVGESFLFDNQRLYAKWLSDIQSAINPLGQLPDAAPANVYRYSDDVVSAAAYFLVPRMLYHQFADIDVVKSHYPSMKKWMAYMEKRYLKNGLMQGVASVDKGVPPVLPGLLEETNPDRLTDGNLIANAYYIRLLQVMQEFAGLLEQTTDQEGFKKKEASMTKAFQRTFYNVTAYCYANNTVTANVLPLVFGITPEEDKKAVFKHICRVIEETNTAHLSTGEVGTAWLLQALSAYGRADLALRLATNRSYPSWGYMAERGATTFWQRWNADKLADSDVSVNHVALMGDVLNWCFENMAGIRCAPDGPGFKRIIMRPDFPDGLNLVRSTLNSMHGMIASKWSREGIHLNWDITVPPNTVAHIYIPAPQGQVYEGGKSASKAVGVSFVKTEGDRSVFELKSGTYSFEVKR